MVECRENLVSILSGRDEPDSRDETLRGHLLRTLETERSLGYWYIDLAADKVFWSERTAILHGEAPGTVPESLRESLSYFEHDDRARVRTEIERAAENCESFSVAARLRQKNGRSVPVQLTGDCGVAKGRAVALWGFIEDATAVERAERLRAAARKAEERLRSAISEMQDGFVLYDADDRLVHCNEQYRALYGVSAPAIRVGARFEDIIRYGLAHGQYPDAIGREEEWLAQRMYAHRHPPTHPIEQQLSDGRWLRVCESITSDGGRAGFRADITDRKMLEAKLGSALVEARASSQLHASLLPNLAHEMRTPLNAIIGFAQMISHLSATEGVSREKLSEYARDIEQSGRHLSSIVNNLLDISDLEGGERRVEPAGVDVASAVRKACRMVAFAARARSKRLETRLPKEPVAVEGDATRLVQVLLNLITNAVKYSPVGGTVEINVTASGPRLVTIDVIDDGNGIAEELHDRLFDRYERLSADSSSAVGSGLGLAIAKEFVEGMGGRIRVENAPGRGAMFSVVLRRAEVQTDGFERLSAAG